MYKIFHRLIVSSINSRDPWDFLYDKVIKINMQYVSERVNFWQSDCSILNTSHLKKYYSLYTFCIKIFVFQQFQKFDMNIKGRYN